jgi:hypothetical protein
MPDLKANTDPALPAIIGFALDGANGERGDAAGEPSAMNDFSDITDPCLPAIRGFVLDGDSVERGDAAGEPSIFFLPSERSPRAKAATLTRRLFGVA